MNTEEKIKCVQKMHEYHRNQIFEATVKLRAGEMSGVIQSMCQGYTDSGWIDCFNTAFDMHKLIVIDSSSEVKGEN